MLQINQRRAPLTALAFSVSLTFGSLLVLSYPADAQLLTTSSTEQVTAESTRRRRPRPRPVPGPVPVLGAVLAACWSRKLRQKCLSQSSFSE
jgi:hypothetical protein